MTARDKTPYQCGVQDGRDESAARIVELEAETETLQRRLGRRDQKIHDMKQAGTPFWKERDGTNALVLENQRLEAVVAELPKTEDGVIITDDSITYCDERIPFAHRWKLRTPTGEPYRDHLANCHEKHYSTEAAAMAATESKGE